MLKSSIAAVVLICACHSAFAEKPRVYTANPLETGVSYNQRARDAYAAGVWTIEEVEMDDSETKVDPEQRQRAYARALLAFSEAVNAEPSRYEAHTYIGYANRKLGNLDESLRAYETALRLKPDYAFAIEYQGETYLDLGDFERAKFNYLRLYALDPALATKLVDAMREWSDHRSKEDRSAASARAWIEAHAKR
jgi:tetratricopeptide (TPR) repeat protein